MPVDLPASVAGEPGSGHQCSDFSLYRFSLEVENLVETGGRTFLELGWVQASGRDSVLTARGLWIILGDLGSAPLAGFSPEQALEAHPLGVCLPLPPRPQQEAPAGQLGKKTDGAWVVPGPGGGPEAPWIPPLSRAGSLGTGEGQRLSHARGRGHRARVSALLPHARDCG